MKITNLTQKFVSYLKARNLTNLLATSLVFSSGLAVASIGATRLSNALASWLSNTSYMGPQFDQMLASSISSTVFILPSLLFFIFAYLIAESHTLGIKLSLVASAIVLSLGIIFINVPLTLAGVLCFLGFEIQYLSSDRSKDKQNSPIITENIAKLGLRISGLIGLLILIGIIVYIVIRGSSYLTLDFIFGKGYAPASSLRYLIEGTQQVGISDYIIGSFLIVGLAEAIALPLGLGASIYMAEYAPNNSLTSTIRFFIETLAGAPSIVIALFGFYFLAQSGFGLGWGVSWLSASVCLAFMTIPWNIRVAEEAMKAVPYSYREGAYALGATKWQTIRKVVFLAAIPGVITGFILGLGAAFGETTVLLLTADIGNNNLPAGLPLTQAGMPSLPVMILRTHFWNIGAGDTSVNYAFEKTNVAFAAGFVLLAIFLVICFTALIARNYWSKKSGSS